MWKSKEIIKNPDDTFTIVHNRYPYQVCSKAADPSNLYDVAEVAAFWEGLPEDDARKRRYVAPEPTLDTRTLEEKRADAYADMADPLLQQYQYYNAEAEACDLLDDEEGLEIAREKAQDFLVAYLKKKKEIRKLYPDVITEAEAE